MAYETKKSGVFQLSFIGACELLFIDGSLDNSGLIGLFFDEEAENAKNCK